MTDAPNPAGQQRNAAFGFIFVSALINALTFGVMIPVLPNLIKQFNHGSTADAAMWNTLFQVSWGLMQFFIGPVLGMLSDRFGRRPVLLISSFGLFVDFLFMAFAPSLQWLYVGRLINGATAASFSTGNAYIADITPPEKRAGRFGLMGAAFGIGFALGPGLGGVMTKVHLDFLPVHDALRMPFILAGALTLINFLYGFFVLPESLAQQHRLKALTWKRANPVAAFAFLLGKGELIGLAAIYFLFQLAHTSLPAVMVLYGGYRYGWTPDVLGYVFLASGVTMIIVQVGLIRRIVASIGERGAVLGGLAAAFVGFSIYAFADKPWIYFLAIPVFAFNGLLMPGLQALMTRRVGPSEQGRLQGVNQGIQGVGSIIANLIFGPAFAFAVRHNAELHLPGLPYLIAAGLVGCAGVMAILFAKENDELAVEPIPAE